MRLVPVLLLATSALALLPSQALADDDPLRWRRTTPRARFDEAGGLIALRVPAGRAWGIESRSIEVESGRSYRVRLDLEVPDEPESAFLRLAYYARPDGRGRQRQRVDSAPVTSGAAGQRSLDFLAPAWARAVKFRVLVRRSSNGAAPEDPVRARLSELRSLDAPAPSTVLRDVD